MWSAGGMRTMDDRPRMGIMRERKTLHPLPKGKIADYVRRWGLGTKSSCRTLRIIIAIYFSHFPTLDSITDVLVKENLNCCETIIYIDSASTLISVISNRIRTTCRNGAGHCEAFYQNHGFLVGSTRSRRIWCFVHEHVIILPSIVVRFLHLHVYLFNPSPCKSA